MHRFFYPQFGAHSVSPHPCFLASVAGSILGCRLAQMAEVAVLQENVAVLARGAVPTFQGLLLALLPSIVLAAGFFLPGRQLWLLLVCGLQSFGLCFCVTACSVAAGWSGWLLGLGCLWPGAASLAVCCHCAVGLYNGKTDRGFSDCLVAGLICCVFYLLRVCLGWAGPGLAAQVSSIVKVVAL